MEGFFRNLFNPGQRRENRRNDDTNNSNGTNRNRRPNTTASSDRNRTSSTTNNGRRPRPAPRASSTPEDTQTQTQTQQPQQQSPPFVVPERFRNANIPPENIPSNVLEFIMQQAQAAGLDPANGATFHFYPQGGEAGPTIETTSNAPPPASQKSIRQLPIVSVTPEDLVDENNRECCICFEENAIGDKVCRLPCAHIFHVHCIHQWLEKHCTCPICRYEIPTDNAFYEKGRKERMKRIKPRFAQYELERMSVRELKGLCERLNFMKGDWAGLDKTDVVNLILQSGKIDVIAAPDPVEYESISTLRGMGVGKLKKAMVEAGVFFDPIHVVEKEDMVQIFVNSGRVIFRQEENGSLPSREYEYSEYKPSSFLSDSVPFRDWERAESGEVKRARLGSLSSQEEEREEEQIMAKEAIDTCPIERVPSKEEETSSQEGGTMSIEEGSAHVGSESLNTNMDSASDAEEPMQVETDNAEISVAPAASLDVEPPVAVAAAASNSQNCSEGQSSSHSRAWSTSSFAARSVGELRQLAAQFDVDLSGCIEKQDMIERLVSALT